MKRILLAAALATALASHAEDALLSDARRVAGAMPPKLLAVLATEIEKGGPEGAIGVCRDRAPQMAKAASEESGWAIRRVSLRNRNPKAVPDAWERAALEDFDRRMAAGESPAAIEKGEVVEQDGRKFYRYAKALPTQATCLACHGETAAMKPAVREKLADLYPEDKATGYREKQVRGAMSLRKPL